MSRKEYIESELKKYNEVYEIGFQEEFDLKAMLDLQYQYIITPKEKIKTIGAIIHTKNQIMKNLNLKPRTKTEKFKVLVIVNDERKQVNISNMFHKMILSKDITDDIKTFSTGRLNIPDIHTKDFDIIFIKHKEGSLSYRGLRADYILNFTGRKEIDDYFKGMNKL